MCQTKDISMAFLQYSFVCYKFGYIVVSGDFEVRIVLQKVRSRAGIAEDCATLYPYVMTCNDKQSIGMSL